MTAFDQAWEVLKALEEQQGFTMSPFTPTEYGQENLQQTAGTIHPAILGLMERTQKPRGKPIVNEPFPDKRIARGADDKQLRVGDIGRRGTMINQEVPIGDIRRMTSPSVFAEQMNPMTGHLSDDELTDAAQRKRGSVFDAGHYNKFGLPMVGVRQHAYGKRRKPRYPNSKPEFQPDFTSIRRRNDVY